MSHITVVEVEVKDLEAVKALCKERGWSFLEGKKTCKFWLGAEHACDHAIGVPDARFGAEIGLVARADGKGFSLAFDAICFPTGTLGKNGGRFMQGYGICKAEREAKRRGLNVRRVQSGNKVKLVMTGNGL